MHNYFSFYNSYCQESLNKEHQRKFLAEQRGDWNAKHKKRRK